VVCSEMTTHSPPLMTLVGALREPDAHLPGRRNAGAGSKQEPGTRKNPSSWPDSAPLLKRRRRETTAATNTTTTSTTNSTSAEPATNVAPSNTDSPPVIEGGGNLTVGCEFDLVEMRWYECAHAGLPADFKVAQLSICSLSAKRRRGREEHESERRAQEILRAPGWSITSATNFEDLECLISTLVRRLEIAGGLSSTTLAWCVGGSLDATLRGRGADGSTRRLRFALCGRDDWSGDRHSTKAGNTCRWHAGGLAVTNVVVCGKLQEHLTLRKCTWMKCCYVRPPPTITTHTQGCTAAVAVRAMSGGVS
jgi:hypothetical protein